MKFDSLDLHPDILKGVVDAGFEKCTPIQEQSLPECLGGKDMIAQSQTGTGKTAVFVLSIYSRLMAEGGASDKPRALVMVPTRELAVQVEQDARKLGKHLPLKTLAIFGGVDYDKQVSPLKGGIDLVVATPGRMIDLYKSKTLSLDDISIFVIDEADRMFDMGFAPDITYIASHLPKEKPRQTMLFSATIDSNVERLASRYMKPDLIRIEIEPEQITVDTIDQKVIYVSNEEKLPVLMGLLKRPDAETVVIFTNMKRTAEMLEWKLQGNGLPAKALTGDMTQAKRQKVIDGMKEGTINILVATDVAARGLHIDGVTHVVNYDLPEDAANYVHRVGRTARAGKTGKAYSLVCESYAINLPDIEKYIDRKIESEWIEDSDLVPDTAGKYTSRPRSPRGASGSGRSGSKSGPRSGSRSGSSSSSRGSSSRGSSSRSASSRGDSKPAPKRGPKPAPATEAKPSAGGESVSTSWSEVKSSIASETRSVSGRERSKTDDKDRPEREKPGRIVRPERVRKPRPARRAPSPVEASETGGEGAADESKGTAPRRRRRRRRPSGARSDREKQAASSGQAENSGEGAASANAPQREGAEGSSPARRRRRRPPRGRGPRPADSSESGGVKAERQAAPAKRSAPAPKPASEPAKSKPGGFLKKVLGVFKKKS